MTILRATADTWLLRFPGGSSGHNDRQGSSTPPTRRLRCQRVRTLLTRSFGSSA